mmetsp:Transcript_55928/g.131690  ORF Transcript_55928/g.131690 Transcript_55928/m.131690 type:complete len:217 (+) Transcript_55928:2880-3530(+)
MGEHRAVPQRHGAVRKREAVVLPGGQHDWQGGSGAARGEDDGGESYERGGVHPAEGTAAVDCGVRHTPGGRADGDQHARAAGSGSETQSADREQVDAERGSYTASNLPLWPRLHHVPPRAGAPGRRHHQPCRLPHHPGEQGRMRPPHPPSSRAREGSTTIPAAMELDDEGDPAPASPGDSHRRRQTPSRARDDVVQIWCHRPSRAGGPRRAAARSG